MNDHQRLREQLAYYRDLAPAERRRSLARYGLH